VTVSEWPEGETPQALPAATLRSERCRPASVLIADDHPPLRALLQSLLERNGFFVCGVAADAAAAIDVAIRTQPDVCLIDVNMPGNGIAATAAIASMVPTAKIVILTVSRNESDLFRAIQAGAVGYLVKGGHLDRLPGILERVLDGEALVSGELMARLLEEFRRRGRPRARLAARARGPLTRREWEVIELLAEDLNTAEIAQRLEIQEVTVRSHVAAILKKLRVESRQAALRWHRARAWSSPDDA
jgi:DNA-binding NarL/FixJ family response regulator